MNFIHSITFRLTLWYLAILSILLMLLGGGVYLTLSQTLYHNLDDSLKTRAEQLARFRDIMSIIAGGTFEEEIGEHISFYFYANGQLTHISHKEFPIPADTALIDAAISDSPRKADPSDPSGQGMFSSVETPHNGKLRIFITPYKPDNPEIRPDRFGKRRPPPREPGKAEMRPDQLARRRPPRRRMRVDRAAMVIARPMRDIETALQQLLDILFIAIPLTILFSCGGGVFIAKRAIRPVYRITNAAREIEEKGLSRRIEVSTKDELGHLAATLNQMIGRLEKAFARQKQFTGDASHELRAPLSVIQAESTLALQKERTREAYRKSVEMIAQEADHMAAIIRQLLTLARADAGKSHFRFEKINLTEFIKDICSDMDILCREKGLNLETILTDDLWVTADRRSFRRLMHNLVINAIRYTEEGGLISVYLKKQGHNAILSVRDTGIGIPADALPHIFERFFRVDKARSRSQGGSGLGLSICSHIAEMHKGGIEVKSTVGKGSVFYVRLRLCQA